MNIDKEAKDIIVLGSGGHSKVLIAFMQRSNQKIIGYTDLVNKGMVQDVPYLGTDDIICRYSPDNVILVNGLGGIGDNSLRKGLFTKFKNLGYSFKTIIHEKAVLTMPYRIEEGAQIFANAIIQPNSSIGSNTIINSGVIIEHDCKVGKHVHVSPGTVLSGGVSIGNETHIGTNSTIIQDIKIGERSLVGAGSVVVEDIKDYVACWGNPARERRNNE